VEEARLGPPFPKKPLQALPAPGSGELERPAHSVTALTGLHLRHDQDGVTVEDVPTPQEPDQP